MRIGALITAWRMYPRKLGIRAAAKQIGVSPATLSRIERGENVDGKTVAKLVIWLFR